MMAMTRPGDLETVEGSGPPTVLVADDNGDLRLLVRLHLERQGWRVIEAVDGEEALEACRLDPPDVVLLDIRMPRLDGWGVLTELKADDALADVPVILLTAQDSSTDVVQGLRLGAHDYLGKPFEPAELCARVDAALRVKRLQDELRRRNEELDLASRTDPLTGLPNRRHLEEQLRRAVSAARRHDHSLAVALIDVDHFKQVNDQSGHETGDEVLRHVALRLRGAVREEDVVGRWGGDEFLALLPYTGLEGARTMAERVRAAVCDTPIAVASGPMAVTVTVGCAAGVADPYELLQSADRGLYEGKAAGRNAVR